MNKLATCKFGWQCICSTCPMFDKCEDQPEICWDCEGKSNDVMLFCSDGIAKGAVRGKAEKQVEVKKSEDVANPMEGTTQAV